MIHSKSKKQIYGKILLSVILTLISVVMVIPFILTIFTSLKPMSEIQSANFTVLPQNWQFGNYAAAMNRGHWPSYFLNSIIVTACTVFFAVLFNTLAGYAFARMNFKWKTPLFFFMLIGIMVPAQVTLIPTFFMMKSFPLAGGNSLFGMGGTGLLDSRAGLIIPYIAGSFGVFLCRQFYLSFPRSLDEAADIDGAGKWLTFFKIYIPLSKPVIATLVITKSVSIWNDYLWPMVLINSDTKKTVQLGLTMFRNESVVQWNYLLAATVLVILPLILVFILFQKYFVGGIIASGLKG
ncbi:carbohydrate ABC transporter permease [Hungatella effluvii]|uniref:carbohydrate ABC transporter permease n=1 Tax=Hungatella effluvii TaxID=1096246 RepID=UPI0022E5E592|nr:carbohydrate ABC transporter permease [Hungatella effluvii]